MDTKFEKKMNTRTITFCCLILFSWVLAACLPGSSSLDPQVPASNFGFTFEFGSCNVDVLDTFGGTFTRDMMVENDITVPLALTDAQMRTIYRMMVEIGFFDYPAVFAIPTPKNEAIGIATPAMAFKITVINGDITKTLSWKDEIIDPTTPEADKLRTLLWLIIGMIQENPVYQELPDPTVVCM
jgi:hypothetical protein